MKTRSQIPNPEPHASRGFRSYEGIQAAPLPSSRFLSKITTVWEITETSGLRLEIKYSSSIVESSWRLSSRQMSRVAERLLVYSLLVTQVRKKLAIGLGMLRCLENKFGNSRLRILALVKNIINSPLVTSSSDTSSRTSEPDVSPDKICISTLSIISYGHDTPGPGHPYEIEFSL